MKETVNNCVNCLIPCYQDCPLKEQEVVVCDECGEECGEIWYEDDDGQYCASCFLSKHERKAF